MVQMLAVFLRWLTVLSLSKKITTRTLPFSNQEKLCWTSASSGCPVGLTPLLWLWLYYNWILLWLNSASLVFLTPPPMVSSLRCFTGSWAYNALLPSVKMVTCSSFLESVPYLKIFVEKEMAFGTSLPDSLWHFWFSLCNNFLSIGTFGSCVKDSWVILRHALFSGV